MCSDPVVCLGAASFARLDQSMSSIPTMSGKKKKVSYNGDLNENKTEKKIDDNSTALIPMNSKGRFKPLLQEKRKRPWFTVSSEGFMLDKLN